MGMDRGSCDSAAMRESGIVWGVETLDSFLASPREFVPGTKMTYDGIDDPIERADLIAYLKEATKTSIDVAD
ncbi:MAG: hypothetical protein GY791_13380 [Alphaproteobacteria bacterium]|nr:hypothetical protein [Alphaproteobacteria bacterium]